ncbi:MAG: 3-deoxy-8-phosphooctulonate synthase [Candidatus Omnitrophica bacterium]|nr:3-deoxy-8-phosphooctulonate synthase [Candidatus Omnitrophota bacterium]
MKTVKVKNIKIGSKNPFCLIAGPCVIEGEKITFETAERLKEITERLKIPFIFKSSYDKANRSSLNSYRGPGLKKGLKILFQIKQKLQIPILSDIHCQHDIDEAAEVLDVIQIPALLSRQTDLILKAASTGKVVNIKKGQFLSPWAVKNVIEKVISTGNKNILITERGTFFGYHNLVSDFRALPIMRKFGYPVIFDATHSVQYPAGDSPSSSGASEFAPYLAQAAVAVGCDGLFLEVHKNPERALCDGPNMLALKDLPGLLKVVKKIDRLIKI